MPSIEDLQKLIADAPDDAFLNYALAQELAKAGRPEEAIAAYDRVIGIDPHYHYAYFHKARVLEDEGRIDDAVAALGAGLRLAQADQEPKAAGELQGYLDTLSP